MTTTDERVDAFDATWAPRRGVRGFFTEVQHKSVGRRYLVTAFVLFLVGGLEALLMRLQLARPGNDVLEAQAYNELFTMHGTTMMFLFAVPFLEGLATYLLPLQLGCRDLPFSRFNSFNYWCYLLGGLVLYSSFLFQLVPDAGWFGYVPLSGPEYSDKALDIWLFGLTLAELSAVGAAIEIIVVVLTQRAPGMSLDRMPIFAWAMLGVGALILVAFVPLLVGSVLLELDRNLGTQFFQTSNGGDPLLWQHLFWIFGHPEVYVMFLPGAAVVSHVVVVHAQRRLVAYPLVVAAVVVTAIMSLGLWVHHMYTTGLPPLTLSFFSAASMSITLASGVQVFAWVLTLWWGKVRFTVPMLWALGFLVTFVLGGITGVMVASAPFDAQVHDTYFVVAHFHYVIVGGMLFPVFAALCHWWPKMSGHMVDHRLGVTGFWLGLVGFHVTFFPMHLMGMWGMPRRVYTYDAYLGVGTLNLIATVGAFVFASGVLVTVAALLRGMRGPVAPDDPWGGDTLEWATSSPPSPANLERMQVVGSRHPLWDPPPGDDEHADVRAAFDHQPEGIRATPLTTIVTGEARGVAFIGGPSWWPLVAAGGLALVVVGLLVESGWLVAVGVVTFVGGLAGWSGHNEHGMDEERTAPVGGRFAGESQGPHAVGWWGAVGAATVLLVAVGTVATSMLYLQVNAPTWPRGDLLGQPLGMATAGLAVVAALAVTWWGARRSAVGHEHAPDPGHDVDDAEHAARRLHARAEPGVRNAQLASAGIALVAALVALAVLAATWFAGGLDPTGHAYASGVLVLVGVTVLAVLMATGVTAAAVWSRLLHRRDSRPGLLLQNASILWGAALLVWATAWFTADLLPTLVI